MIIEKEKRERGSYSTKPIMIGILYSILKKKKDEDLSKFMRYLTHTHTQRYHAHYKTIGYGHVYQGRYKSFPVEQDTYFLQLCRYVEKNPLRAGLVEKAQDWKYSSLSIRKSKTEKQKQILSKWPMEKPKNYIQWVNTLQKDEEEKLKIIRYSLQKGKPFGEDSWIKSIAKKLNLLSTLRKRGRPKKGT